MRITTSSLTNSVTSSMSNAYEVYANILEKISSNKNFTKISENITDSTKVLKLKNQLAELEGYQSNITAATNEMDLAYDTLSDILDELSSINSLIVEASNATTTSESAQAIADEIEQRTATIMDKMNTQYLDTYIFSGTNIYQQTYTTDDDGNVIYNGSSSAAGDRNLTIAEGKTFTYNITGEEILGSTDDTNGFFSQMSELCELLRADTLDYDAIREKLDSVESTVTSVSQAQGKVSAYVSKLDSMYDANTNTITNLTEQRADLEEVDLTQAATDLATAQTALEASYSIGTLMLSSVSLLDYLY